MAHAHPSNYWIGPDDLHLAHFSIRFDMDSCLLLAEGEEVNDILAEDPDSKWSRRDERISYEKQKKSIVTRH